MAARSDRYPAQKRRLEMLQEPLKAQGLSGLLVTQPENRRYLSGFKPADPQLNESAGFLIVGGSLAILGTDPRYEIEARREAGGYTPFIYNKGLEGSWPQITGLLQGMQRLGFETGGLTYHFYQRLKKIIRKSKASIQLTPTQNLVEGLRARKDPGEIKAIRRSLAVTEAVFQEMAASLRPGQTERSIAWKIKTLIHQKGGEAIAFEPIVASGPNASQPHAEPTDRPIQKGEPIIFDFGAKVDGYCSDLSRTIFLGRRNDRFREVYGLVRLAQEKAEKGIRAGLSTREADTLARSVIDQGGYGRHFNHSLGHGVGLATHELPSLSPVKPALLEAGMVVTIEPGIYLPDWGGVRLENMVVIGERKSRLLNREAPFYNLD
jgi:Xaa-Pro aminopeptidase